MTENIYEKSVGEAADIIATAQRLIEAGVNSGDNELIEAGRKRWKEVWPDEIVDRHVDLYVKDLREELGRPSPPG
jgi:hypothetical protein